MFMQIERFWFRKSETLLIRLTNTNNKKLFLVEVLTIHSIHID